MAHALGIGVVCRRQAAARFICHSEVGQRAVFQAAATGLRGKQRTDPIGFAFLLLVLGPRPLDYHPDHRYTGILLQDAAFMVTVPNIAPDTPALRQNPVFMYFEDSFQKPNTFTPDVAVSIDDTFSKKIDAIDAHVSQMYEWLPWLNGRLESVPADPAARRAMTAKQRFGRISDAMRATLVKFYGAEAGAKVEHAEAFEICEYGRKPSDDEIRQLFPMLK